MLTQTQNKLPHIRIASEGFKINLEGTVATGKACFTDTLQTL